MAPKPSARDTSCLSHSGRSSALRPTEADLPLTRQVPSHLGKFQSLSPFSHTVNAFLSAALAHSHASMLLLPLFQKKTNSHSPCTCIVPLPEVLWDR